MEIAITRVEGGMCSPAQASKSWAGVGFAQDSVRPSVATTFLFSQQGGLVLVPIDRRAIALYDQPIEVLNGNGRVALSQGMTGCFREIKSTRIVMKSTLMGLEKLSKIAVVDAKIDDMGASVGIVINRLEERKKSLTPRLLWRPSRWISLFWILPNI